LLGASGQEASAAADEARTTFERLGAAPFAKLLADAKGVTDGMLHGRRAEAPVSSGASAPTARVE
jgi:hypothetical protein